MGVLPARPSSMVTTTFPAVFMMVDRTSRTPAANTNSFVINCGGDDWTGVLSSEVSQDEPSVMSLPPSDSVSDTSSSCCGHTDIGLNFSLAISL